MVPKMFEPLRFDCTLMMMIWWFMSLSTLFKAYQDDGSMIIKRLYAMKLCTVKRKILPSAEVKQFSLQQNSNSGDLKKGELTTWPRVCSQTIA